MAVTMRIPTEFTAIDKFSSVVAKMTSGVTNFTKSTSSAVSRVNNKIDNTFKKLDSISQLALGAGAAGLFVVAGNAVMDYETALHSLEAVTGVTSDKFKSQIESIAKKTNESSIDVAKSFEIIGSSMSQYLDNPKALGEISQAGIMLSKAARMDLEPALESLTSSMNQFNLDASKAVDTVNRLTAGEIVGSVKTADATAQLSKFGAVANSINVSLPESVALIQTLGKKFTGASQSEIGTAAKNLLLIMDASSIASKAASVAMDKNGVSTKILMDRSLSLGERLKELSKIKKDGAAMALVFGKENAAAGSVIFDQLNTYVEWEKKIRLTNDAQKQATVNSNTLAKGFQALKNQFINSIVSEGKLTPALGRIKDAAFWVAANMDSILSVITVLIASYAALKTILVISAIWTFIHNVALGVQNALLKKSIFYVESNKVAKAADAVTTKLMTAYTWLASYATIAWNTAIKSQFGFVYIATAAQWLWNAAMTANPIGLIIVGIAALIALIVAVVAKWDEWGAAVSLFMGPLGFVISLIQSFRRNWDMIVNAFKTEGIIGGLKAIGVTILDAVLQPLEQLLSLLAKIPGMGMVIKPALGAIQGLRESMGVNLEGNNAPGKAIKKQPSPEQMNQTIMQQNTLKGGLNVNIRDKGNNVKDTSLFGNSGIPVKVTSTQGSN